VTIKSFRLKGVSPTGDADGKGKRIAQGVAIGAPLAIGGTALSISIIVCLCIGAFAFGSVFIAAIEAIATF
jgi:hypothetical protein